MSFKDPDASGTTTQLDLYSYPVDVVNFRWFCPVHIQPSPQLDSQERPPSPDFRDAASEQFPAPWWPISWTPSTSAALNAAPCLLGHLESLQPVQIPALWTGLGNCPHPPRELWGSHLMSFPFLREWSFILPTVHCLTRVASFILSRVITIGEGWPNTSDAIIIRSRGAPYATG